MLLVKKKKHLNVTYEKKHLNVTYEEEKHLNVTCERYILMLHLKSL